MALRFHSYITQKLRINIANILGLIFLRQTIAHTENYMGTDNNFQIKSVFT